MFRIVNIYSRSHQILPSFRPCRSASMTLLLLVLSSIVCSTLAAAAVEAMGETRRVEQLQRAAQTLRDQLEELRVANAMLHQEIAQIEQDGERLDHKTNMLITQEGPLKDELVAVKTAVISALATVETIPLIQKLLHTRLRWMGEVDKEEFARAYEAVVDTRNPSHRYDARLSLACNAARAYKAVCVALVRSQLWSPFRVDPEKEVYVPKLVDPIRERLREVWGEAICDLVLAARRELLDYNPSGAYSVPMPWDPMARHVVKHSEVIKQFGITVLQCNRLMENCECSAAAPPHTHSSPPHSPPHSPPRPQTPFYVFGPSDVRVAWDDGDDRPTSELNDWDWESDSSVETGEGFEQGGPDVLGFENWQDQGPLAPPNSPVAAGNDPQEGSPIYDSGGGVGPPSRWDPLEVEYDPHEETEEYLYNLIG